jgi:hypothetical protein
VNVPVAVPLEENVTMPDGLIGVPRFELLSITVAVQVDA